MKKLTDLKTMLNKQNNKKPNKTDAYNQNQHHRLLKKG